MDSVDRLAKKFAELHLQNRNPNSTAPRLCSVVGVDPLVLQWGQSIIISADRIYLPRLYSAGIQIPNRYLTQGGGFVEETLTLKIDLQVGDKVIVAPDDDLKSWYLIDRI